MTELLGKNLLVLTAHPDDESYFVAGTLHRNRQYSGRSTLICASLGGLGQSHLRRPVPRRILKARREKEIRQASRIIGVDELVLWRYPDQHIGDHARALVTRGLAVARRRRTDAIISFGPDGITGHVDHVALAVAAKTISQRLKLPLFVFTIAPAVATETVAYFATRRRGPYYRNRVVYRRPTVRVAVNRRIKLQAMACHQSQLDQGKVLTGFPLRVSRSLLTAEYFSRVR